MNFIDLYNQTNSSLYLFGEFHGTKEMPQAFISVMKEALTLNKKINVFLEFPSDMQEILNKYLEDKVSYKEFLKTKIYNPPKDYYDGRLSKAMFGIINFIKENKDKINIYFVDNSIDESLNDGKDRDLIMSENVFKFYDENKINFYYVGSAHAVTKENENDWFTKYYKEHNYLPCGMYLKKKIPNVISVKFESLKEKVLTAYGFFDKPETIKVKYTKSKVSVKKECNVFIKEDNKSYDYFYYIKRATPAYKLR